MTTTAITSVGDWQHAFADPHGAMRITVPDREAPWSSRLEVRRTSSYGVALCGGGRQFVSRQSRHIRADPRGRFELVCRAAEGGSASAPADRRTLVETEIRQHAAEPGLDVTTVARALGWSPRYLQRVLRDAGTTPRDLIRRERLLLARSRPADPAWSGTSIAGIARSCGFGSHASFTAAFRAEFGVRPRDARS